MTNDTKTLHTRNLHNNRYDFPTLIKTKPQLQEFVKPNKYGDLSIDFANPQAVISLNKALLAHFYGIKNYTIPDGYFCPPFPGRADYVHNIDDLSSNNGELLNTISNTKMNDLYKEIYSNLQKVLPEKAKLLGIDLPKDILSKLDPDADKKTITEKDLTGYTVYKDSTTRNTICLS